MELFRGRQVCASCNKLTATVAGNLNWPVEERQLEATKATMIDLADNCVEGFIVAPWLRPKSFEDAPRASFDT